MKHFEFDIKKYMTFYKQYKKTDQILKKLSLISNMKNWIYFCERNKMDVLKEIKYLNDKQGVWIKSPFLFILKLFHALMVNSMKHQILLIVRLHKGQNSMHAFSVIFFNSRVTFCMKMCKRLKTQFTEMSNSFFFSKT